MNLEWLYHHVYYLTLTNTLNIARLTSISIALEVEPELEDVVMELAAESTLVAILPLLVHYLERNVFVGWT
jgi:hypothetical protein